ncbi:hypothetical protein ABPG77_002462 [Micractinium sp. CCAP 211/92]
MPFPKGAKAKGSSDGGSTAGSENACGLCSAAVVDDDDPRGFIRGTCSKCGTRRFHFDCVSGYLEKNIARNRPHDLFAQNRTVQRKPQKCAISPACTGLMIEAELIKPQKPQRQQKQPPPATPVPRPKQPAAAAPKAPKPPEPQAGADSAKPVVPAKPLPPPKPLPSAHGSNTISAACTSATISTGVTREVAAKENLQQLRASAAAARASLGASSTASRAAGRLSVSNRAAAPQPEQQRQPPLQVWQHPGSTTDRSSSEPPVWMGQESAEAVAGNDEDADIRAAIAASLAEQSMHAARAAQQAAGWLTHSAAAGNSIQATAQVAIGDASLWPDEALPRAAESAARHLPAVEQPLQKPGSPGSDDEVDYVGLAAALRRQQELLSEQWRRQGAQQAWTQPPSHLAEPPTPVPQPQPQPAVQPGTPPGVEQPWAGMGEDRDQRQLAEPLYSSSAPQLGPEQQAQERWPEPGWEAAQQSADDAEVDALLGLLGIPA